MEESKETQLNEDQEIKEMSNRNINHKQKGKFRRKHENLKKGRLIVRNLSFKVTEETLTQEFQKYGAIKEINLLKKADGKLVGCAFVQYENYQDSLKAIKELNGKDFMKRKVTVDFAVSKNRYKPGNESNGTNENLSFETTNEDLHKCFKKYGPIKYALVVKDPVSGHSKGTGFVRFLKKESVNMCMQQTGLISLQNFTLDVFPSLPKQKIMSLEVEKKKQDPKDTRHMYLLREGMVIAGSAAAEGVSATDMSKRLRLEQIKSQMLKNLNRFLSRERLTIHNLPENFDDAKLRKTVATRTGLKPIECRVMRENKPSPAHPKGKSKGFGFLSFKKHEDALAVLRKLNNNPDVFSANHRPIVSFSIEDKNVLNIKEKRKERSMLNNPTYQKKLEKLKLKKLEKKKAKSLKDKKNKKLSPVATNDEKEEQGESYSGFAAKPGAFVKLRGTFKLKEQSKIHEKSMQDHNKKAKREKLMTEIRKDKEEKKLNQTKKRKIDSTTHDSLSKMIDKYKSLITGNDDDESTTKKRIKTRGKWFLDST
ncbi:CLUMA_CG008492, isoform A [Clunio marinus]|uniref:CLUMA_CG008492, isoform A n=1 Tax=Clunio marinus TaxID=568069 RepID=A0A1J1I7R9_9DIPT|nr:CLUMA_CG008492, isoform A [Clunio marinus]